MISKSFQRMQIQLVINNVIIFIGKKYQRITVLLSTDDRKMFKPLMADVNLVWKTDLLVMFFWIYIQYCHQIKILGRKRKLQGWCKLQGEPGSRNPVSQKNKVQNNVWTEEKEPKAIIVLKNHNNHSKSIYVS